MHMKFTDSRGERCSSFGKRVSSLFYYRGVKHDQGLTRSIDRRKERKIQREQTSQMDFGWEKVEGAKRVRDKCELVRKRQNETSGSDKFLAVRQAKVLR